MILFVSTIKNHKQLHFITFKLQNNYINYNVKNKSIKQMELKIGKNMIL